MLHLPVLGKCKKNKKRLQISVGGRKFVSFAEQMCWYKSANKHFRVTHTDSIGGRKHKDGNEANWSVVENGWQWAGCQGWQRGFNFWSYEM